MDKMKRKKGVREGRKEGGRESDLKSRIRGVIVIQFTYSLI